MTVAWFHCFSGIAGDMALGSLVDAGAELSEVRSLLDRLPVAGWTLEAEPVLRGGIAATKLHVRTTDTTVVRTAAHIQGLVAEARLPDRVQQRAASVFTALAQAEGRLHRRPPDQVHFHEVGGIDAIVDVVGTCAALELLEVDTVAASPVAVGLGMVRSAHGAIPNPAPAVVELLQGIPTQGVDLSVELTTPTGAALVSALATSFGALPSMTVVATGFGAGTRELEDLPNCTQVVIGEPAEERADEGQPVTLLEANVDDASGEVLGHTLSALLAAGAHDAWVTPVVMKKGRPGHTVHALADPALTLPVRTVLATETGTLGVRAQQLQRWPASRHHDRVLVGDLSVRVKVSPGRVKAEFDDAARVAARSGRPVREVIAEAEATWRHSHGGRTDPATSEPDPARPSGRANSSHLHEAGPGDIDATAGEGEADADTYGDHDTDGLGRAHADHPSQRRVRPHLVGPDDEAD